ncbi:MAG TPA: putative sugar O-methyltransferase [Syntrophorhabdales bacterium]|nr:putative sugar O-methyltransferase [Syntrophorhabdales bacterium]
MARDEYSCLEKLVEDFLMGPHIYHPSEFWKVINEKNTNWIKEDGLENFKRSVNNNYFNWMVWFNNDYFWTLCRRYFRSLARDPLLIRLLFSGSIEEMHSKTLGHGDHRVSIWEKNIYRIYLMWLYDYVQQTDPFGLLSTVEEPEIGNPIICRYKNKRISQDVCNSYLEYAYIRTSLGDEFKKIDWVAEIGAGYGRLMYLFAKLHPDKKLIIVDIPPALFISQWYLGNVFSDKKIMKYCRFEQFCEIEESFMTSQICFLLPHQLELVPDKSIDLFINISSFHEMKMNQIKRYYDLVDRKGRFLFTKQWSFWENAVDRQTMPAVAYPTKSHWELIAARLDPVHQKFFEALFELDPRV